MLKIELTRLIKLKRIRSIIPKSLINPPNIITIIFKATIIKDNFIQFPSFTFSFF